MNGQKQPGRSRPTNNQLLYRAKFHWGHFTSPLEPGMDLPESTEACASVTSAFLQVLATLHRVESARTDRPRNILQLLSTNTRRTKVVELSSGTHRVADELRRHSLTDGEGGHYSTNLDRNRYGSDNNYLFTVTKFNLDCLGLCPCLVDIEIVDTRNGNESQLVSAGAGACSCSSPSRKERADASHFAGSGAPRSSPMDLRRVASTGHLSGHGLKRVPSAPTMRRPPSSGRLAEHAERGAERAEREAPPPARATHSRNSGGGSELFDALLLAATEDRAAAPSRGEPPVTSLHYPNAGLGRQRSRPWAHSEVDSLQNAIDAFKAEEEIGTGGLTRMNSRSRRMLRRNSVSMIIENPVLAQTGAAESLLLNHYPPFQALPPLRSPAAGGGTPAGGAGGEAAEPSVRSHEGDTEGKDTAEQEVDDEQHASFRQGLLRHYHKQSSAVNLSRMAHPAELRRLQDELRQLRDENRGLEGELEEAKMQEREARDAQAAAERELEAARAQARRAADVVQRLRRELQQLRPAGGAGGSASAPSGSPAAAAAGEPAPGGGEAATAAVNAESAGSPAAPPLDFDALDAELLEGVPTSEQEITALRGQVEAGKKALSRAEGERREVEGKLAALTAALGGPAAAQTALRHAALVAAAGPAMAMGPPLPMFGVAPLNPYASMQQHAAAAAAAAAAAGGGSGGGFRVPMPKVASMPILGPGMISPQHHTHASVGHHLPPVAPLGPGEWLATGLGGPVVPGSGGRKRRYGSSPAIPEDEADDAPPRSRRHDEQRLGGGPGGKRTRSPSTDPMEEDGEEGAGESDGVGDLEEGGNSSGDVPPEVGTEPEAEEGEGQQAQQRPQRRRKPAGGGGGAAAQQGEGEEVQQGAAAQRRPQASEEVVGGRHAATSAQQAQQQQQLSGTPKDAPLLPLEPVTGASVGPLGLLPSQDLSPGKLQQQTISAAAVAAAVAALSGGDAVAPAAAPNGLEVQQPLQTTSAH